MPSRSLKVNGAFVSLDSGGPITTVGPISRKTLTGLTNGTIVKESSLMAFWNMNESVDTRHDSSGHGVDLTTNRGSVGQTGGVGATFDGNSSLNAGSFIFPVNQDFTISFWVNTESGGDVYGGHIVGNYDGIGMFVSLEGTNYHMTLYNGGTMFGMTVPANFGQWQHLVFRKTGNVVEGFSNGASLGTEDTGGMQFAGGAPFCIGDHGSFEYGVIGQVDAVGIWKAALENAQVATLYSGGKDLEAISFSDGLGDIYKVIDETQLSSDAGWQKIDLTVPSDFGQAPLQSFIDGFARFHYGFTQTGSYGDLSNLGLTQIDSALFGVMAALQLYANAQPININLSGNALDQTSVDGVLSFLTDWGPPAGNLVYNSAYNGSSVDLSGGTNSQPSGNIQYTAPLFTITVNGVPYTDSMLIIGGNEPGAAPFTLIFGDNIAVGDGPSNETLAYRIWDYLVNISTPRYEGSSYGNVVTFTGTSYTDNSDVLPVVEVRNDSPSNIVVNIIEPGVRFQLNEKQNLLQVNGWTIVTN